MLTYLRSKYIKYFNNNYKLLFKDLIYKECNDYVIKVLSHDVKIIQMSTMFFEFLYPNIKIKRLVKSEYPIIKYCFNNDEFCYIQVERRNNDIIKFDKCEYTSQGIFYTNKTSLSYELSKLNKSEIDEFLEKMLFVCI